MQRIFPLLLCVWACASPAPPTQQNAGAEPAATHATTLVLPQSPPPPEDTSVRTFPNAYACLAAQDMHQDSASIGLFSNCWYACAFGTAYKDYQQFGVVFPFEYVVVDSTGREQTLTFHSVGDMAAWRSTQRPELNAPGLEHFGSPRRVLWEGHPGEMYGDSLNASLPYDIADSTHAIVTYQYPWNRVDYYFRKEALLWRVYKRVQHAYGPAQLRRMEHPNFEDFLLRFISDEAFNRSSIKWPLKSSDSAMEDEHPKVSYLSKKEWDFDTSFVHLQPLMTVVTGSAGKHWPDRDTMYLRTKDEGGICGGSIFTKINGRWMLVEVWDASN